MIYTINRLTEPRLDQKEFAYLIGGLRGGIFASQIKPKAQTNLSLKEQSRNLRLSQLKARKAQNTQPGQNRSWLSRFGFGNKKAQGNQLTNQKSGGGLWSRLKGLVGGQKPSINKTNYKSPGSKSQVGVGNNNSSGNSVPSSVMSISKSAGNNNYFLNSKPNLPNNNNKFPSSAKIQSNIKAVPKPSIMKKGEGTPNNIGNATKGIEFRGPVQKTPPTPTPTQRIEGGWKSNANYFYNNNKFPQLSPNKTPPIQAQGKIPTPSNEVRVNTHTNIPTRDQSRRSVMARQQTPTHTDNTSGSVMSQQPQYNYVSGGNTNTNTLVLNTSGSSSSGATYKVPRVDPNSKQPSGASAGKQNPQGQGQQGGGGKGKQNPQGQGQQNPQGQDKPKSKKELKRERERKIKEQQQQQQQNPGSGNNNNSGSGNNQNQQTQGNNESEGSQGMSTTEKILLGGGLATTGYGLYAMSGGGRKKKQEE